MPGYERGTRRLTHIVWKHTRLRVVVPSGAAVFAGDTINAESGKAFITFAAGDSVILGPGSQVRVTGTQNVPAVEVVKGMSRLQFRTKEVRLLASTWTVRAKPDAKTGRLTADVVRDGDGSVSLNVKEGELEASRGREVAVAAAGRPVMLPAAALPPGSPQQAPPPAAATTGKGKALVIAALAVGIAGIAAGAAVLASKNDTGAEANALAAAARQQAAQAQQQAALLQQQNAALQAQLTAAQAQVTAVQTELNSALAGLAAESTLLAQLQTLVNSLSAAQTQLITVQSQLAPLAQKVASGQTLTPAEQQQLASLTAQQTALANTITTLTGQVAQASAQAGSQISLIQDCAKIPPGQACLNACAATPKPPFCPAPPSPTSFDPVVRQ